MHMAEPIETDTLKGNTDEKQENVITYPDLDNNTNFKSEPKESGTLSFLDGLDEIYIQQPFRSSEFCIEACCGWEIENKYTAYKINKESNTITGLFELIEESNCCLRQCCGNNRPFTLRGKIQDTEINIFRIERPFRCGWICCSPLCCCGRAYIEIYANNIFIGSVREMCICCNCKINYSIHNANGDEICQLQRFCIICDAIQTGFDILIDGQETDKKITKLFSGLLKELFTSNDNYLVEFPNKLKSRENKLLLIGASMLLEYKYFENKTKDGDDHIN
eukprot:240641_1